MASNSDIQASEIKEIFELFNTGEEKINGVRTKTNYVKTSELGSLLRAININPTESELADLIVKIDPTNSQQFNLQQLENLVRFRGKDQDTLQEVMEALKVFDTDHDGKLAVEEFLYAMVNMGDKMTPEEVKEIIGDTDLDNGCIKIEEFAKMIMHRI